MPALRQYRGKPRRSINWSSCFRPGSTWHNGLGVRMALGLQTAQSKTDKKPVSVDEVRDSSISQLVVSCWRSVWLLPVDGGRQLRYPSDFLRYPVEHEGNISIECYLMSRCPPGCIACWTISLYLSGSSQNVLSASSVANKIDVLLVERAMLTLPWQEFAALSISYGINAR